MISDHGIYGISAVIYGLAAVACFVFSRRRPAQLRRYCYALVGVVTVAAITSAVWAVDIGGVMVGTGEVAIPQLIDGLVVYPVLAGFAAFTAGSSRRMIAFVGSISAAQRTAFAVAAISEGVVSLLMLGIVCGGFFFQAYLFFGPVYRTAQQRSENRQLLYWKFRNLFLFLIGMLIFTGVLSLSPLLDAFTGDVAIQYISVMLRVGFAGFLIANVDALAQTTTDDIGSESASTTATGVGAD